MKLLLRSQQAQDDSREKYSDAAISGFDRNFGCNQSPVTSEIFRTRCEGTVAKITNNCLGQQTSESTSNPTRR
ncbi:hypothetical protein KOR42_38970 [Thalassoglobus neptunius]|uniref:Uncharacterized protein n=1 Tax=Thalassoglobus neptunius TaxID=1938619 RepID=A0A5C5WGB9_9PLAN|nr:hypothetical protein KOR42_38970 [Thalassoglobus neptunius]